MWVRNQVYPRTQLGCFWNTCPITKQVFTSRSDHMCDSSQHGQCNAPHQYGQEVRTPQCGTLISVPCTSVGRDSSVDVATCYALDGPGTESRWGRRFYAPVQTDPGAHPASCIMGTASFPGVKRPGRGVGHPPPSSAEVRERVELYLCSPLDLRGLF